ncbi:MAG: DNA lyase [Nanoarchaeota archaeon]|nr:DNA lyase [Nanoarchaeota archaeon]MBU4451475.1 DNA lyase [Nanoarchaeota archaeon]
MDIKSLKAEYDLKKSAIKLRLLNFEKIRTHEQIFYEMCYCIMTANGSAKAGRIAQKQLEETKFLQTGIIGECVQGVRYCENKKKFLMHNRANLIANEINLSKYLSGNAFELREKIANNSRYFKGLGWKESSHFLRNVGFCGLAILDRHILKNLKTLGAIDNIPKSISKRTYLEIEEKLKVFCETIGISMDEFDILIWAHESGTTMDEAK